MNVIASWHGVLVNLQSSSSAKMINEMKLQKGEGRMAKVRIRFQFLRVRQRRIPSRASKMPRLLKMFANQHAMFDKK